MLNNSTIETLKAMHCSAMASELKNQFNDSATYGTLAFEERVALMVDAEWNRRQQNKLQKLIKSAPFRNRQPVSKTLNTCLTANWIRHSC